MGYKTTKKHFKLFKEIAEFWVERLGLKDYDIDYEHVKFSDNSLADCSWNIVERWAKIRLSTKWGETKPTKHEICATAIHEVLELLMAEIFTIAQQRYIAYDQLEISRHSVIQRLVSYFMHDEKGLAE